MSDGVLVDTTVWSLGLRRGEANPAHADELRRLILASRVRIIGPIRQEILSGIKLPTQFRLLKERLSAFSDVPLTTGHFEDAAELANACRAKGIQGSHTDFLICAVAKREKFAVFTTDHDFEHYARVIGLAFHHFADT